MQIRLVNVSKAVKYKQESCFRLLLLGSLLNSIEDQLLFRTIVHVEKPFFDVKF